MGLFEGEQQTLKDLLYGLLLPSGNDAAVTIAQHVGATIDAVASANGGPAIGGYPRFVRMMNGEAVRLGLVDTHYTNPQGFDDDMHYSSAYDVALLAREVLRYPLLADIVSTRTATVGTNPQHALANTNELLGVYPGVDGVKTGDTEGAGQCLAASWAWNGRHLIGVLLGSADRATEMTNLLNWGIQYHSWATLLSPLLAPPAGEGESPDAASPSQQRPRMGLIPTFVNPGTAPGERAVFSTLLGFELMRGLGLMPQQQALPSGS
jgi:serine-type D-Ala-D-Ala carboxypeptidase (penicillin-binding protein 5/6)